MDEDFVGGTYDEVSAIDQNFANNLEKMDQYEPGSKEREGLLAENKFYQLARDNEANALLKSRELDLKEQELAQDRKHKVVETIVKVTVGIIGTAAGLIVAFGEMDLEENGSNRSKASQKAGSFFKPWK